MCMSSTPSRRRTQKRIACRPKRALRKLRNGTFRKTRFGLTKSYKSLLPANTETVHLITEITRTESTQRLNPTKMSQTTTHSKRELIRVGP